MDKKVDKKVPKKCKYCSSGDNVRLLIKRPDGSYVCSQCLIKESIKQIDQKLLRSVEL